MTKTELIDAIFEDSTLNKKQLNEALNLILSGIQSYVAKGEKVVFPGFGSFEKRERGERKGRNPQTNEEIVIPPSSSPVFKPGKAFKDLVKGD